MKDSETFPASSFNAQTLEQMEKVIVVKQEIGEAGKFPRRPARP